MSENNNNDTDLTAAEHRMMAMVETHQSAMEKSQRKEERASYRALFIAVISAVLLVGVALLFIYYAKTADSRLAATIKEFTYVQEQFKFKDLGVQAQREAFRKFGMKLFTVHGKAYDSKAPIAFSKRQKVEFLELSFNISDDLRKMGAMVTEWDGLATSIGESDLNPYCEGSFGEIGAFQFKWKTAVIAYGHYMLMPDWFKKKYKIELIKKEDLINPYVSCVLYYVYYADLLKEYRGSEMWAMSEYHWGLTFLGNSYQDGQGDLPVMFIIEGKEYFVPDYYMHWVALRDALELGQLEVGKGYARDLQRSKRKMLREEVTLNNSKNIIKGLRNEVRDIKALATRLQTKVSQWGKKEEAAYNKFTKIYDIIQSGEFTDMKKEMNKHKPIVVEWVKKYEEAKKTQKFIYWVVLIFISLAILALIVFTIKWAFYWRLLKWREKHPKR